jgi:phenylpyruvate tautomerase PptA (4-oxalocrotonate tautomerase family)
MLDELESHAWKNGDIVDTGKHNDLVMALAHAVDQFSGAEMSVPVVMKSMQKSGWNVGGKPKRVQRGNRRNGSGLGGKVLGRRL